jgi:hypothetical protein
MRLLVACVLAWRASPSSAGALNDPIPLIVEVAD